MNQMLEIIQKRRSIRKFNDTPINENLLMQIIEAGRHAPSGGNCQNTHFIAITNAEVLETLRQKVKQEFATMEYREDLYLSLKNSIKSSKNGSYNFDYKAPALVVVCNQKNYPNAMADSACALQNMMLMATSLEVGSCWINQLHWLDENKNIREFLKPFGVAENETICGSLALGNFDGKWVNIPRKGMKVDFVK